MHSSVTGTSVPAHLFRGGVGFGLLFGSIALLRVVGVPALVLAPAGLVVLRGCPTCWAIGLVEMISRGRVTRACTDGSCRVARPPRAPD